MITVANAHRHIMAALPSAEKETINLDRALGRILAKDILAARPQPLFTNSAMDGFAVVAMDLEGAAKHNPVQLIRAGVIHAGSVNESSIVPGRCMEIMTGAPIPAGADAVVKVEDTGGFDSDPVDFFTDAAPGDNIRFMGEELAEGSLLIPAHTKIGPAKIGVIAGAGIAEINVYMRPRVAVFSTGDELVEPGLKILPGQIYNSNYYLLKELVKLAGGEVVAGGVLRDDREELDGMLADALLKCDVIVISGGVSMGKFDHVRDSLQSQGVIPRFWKVAQKPGKPFYFGQSADAQAFGLPGNPVSSFIVFMEYVWPVLQKMQKLAPVPKMTALLTTPFPVEPGKHRFLFGNIWLDEGVLVAAPTDKLGSHMLTSSTFANAILDAPPGTTPLLTGDTVSVRLLPWTDLGGLGEQDG